jgi:hypothetical protein
MFGQKPQLKQQTLQRTQALNPDELQLLKNIYADSNEIYSRTFLPLTLINRPLVVRKLHGLRKDIDKLIGVL